ncbi:MAG TPA: DUF6788 family protein [Bryobacteraceae bacterium]|jgi:hypothetical protein
MSPTLAELEQKKRDLVGRVAQLKDFRPGSVTGLVRRCGKSTCHCAHPDDPGHGPTLRLTYKLRGKTVTESLPTPLAVRKAEREIAEYRKFQQISRDFVEVNEQLCRLRPIEETLTPQEKKRWRRSSSKPLKT